MPIDGVVDLDPVDFRRSPPTAVSLWVRSSTFTCLGRANAGSMTFFCRVLLIGLQISLVRAPAAPPGFWEWAILVVSRSTTGVSNSSERS